MTDHGERDGSVGWRPTARSEPTRPLMLMGAFTSPRTRPVEDAQSESTSMNS